MITMPTWVFFLLLLLGVVLNVFLLWANSVQAHEIRKLRRRLQRRGSVTGLSLMGGGR